MTTIFAVTERSRYIDCLVCGNPTDQSDGTRIPGCLIHFDAGLRPTRVHVITTGVYVAADPHPVCEWYEGCGERAVVGQNLCRKHDAQWRAENPSGTADDEAARARPD